MTLTMSNRHKLVYFSVIMYLICVQTHAKKQKKRNNGDVEIEIQHLPDDCYQKAKMGDEVIVHYTGMLMSGQVFDSSRHQERGPFNFVLGENQVIPGWERGIDGMCIGEQRKLVIPPHLAYGDRGYPPTIPPEATLKFEVELMGIKGKPIEEQVVGFLQLIAVPLLVGVVLYYLYDRYRKEQTARKEEKGEKKTIKKKRH